MLTQTSFYLGKFSSLYLLLLLWDHLCWVYLKKSWFSRFHYLFLVLHANQRRYYHVHLWSFPLHSFQRSLSTFSSCNRYNCLLSIASFLLPKKISEICFCCLNRSFLKVYNPSVCSRQWSPSLKLQKLSTGPILVSFVCLLGFFPVPLFWQIHCKHCSWSLAFFSPPNKHKYSLSSRCQKNAPVRY